MSNRTYICADCRAAKRAEAGAWMSMTRHPCPRCGQPMSELSPRYRIPSKRNDKVWRELKQYTDWYLATYEERRKDYGRKQVAKLDQQIGALERQNAELSRRAWLNDLRKEREEIVRAFLDGKAEK